MRRLKKINIDISPANLSRAVRGLKDSLSHTVSHYNRQNLNIMPFIIYGLLYDMVLNLYKPFATKYLERLGASNMHITLYNSLPGIIAVLVLLPCLFIVSRFKKKRQVTAAFMLAGRLIILSMAFVPIFPYKFRPVIFVFLIALLNFPEAVSQSSMQSILGDCFGGRDRATALSTRNQFGNFFIMLITLFSGLALSFIPRNDNERIFLYQAFFVLAFITGLFEVRYFLKMNEKNNPLYVETETVPAKIKDLGAIFKDKKFIAFSALTLLFYMSFHGGWAIYSIFALKELGATEIWLAVFAVVSGVCAFLSAPFWNRQIAKRGNETVLAISCFIMGVNMFMTVLSPNLFFLIPQSAVGGFGSIALNVTLLNGLLMNTPDKNRMLYIGVYNTAMNISLGISPLIIQFIMDRTSLTFVLYLVSYARVIIAGLMYLEQRKRANGK